MPYRVTPDQVCGLNKNLTCVAATATNAMDIRNLVYRNATTLHDTIENLAWTGKASDAACDRAEREYREQRAAGDVFEDLHDTCAAVHDRMGWLIDALQTYLNNAAGRPGIGVARDWTVTIKDDGNRAATDTRRLQSYADQLGALDEQFAAAVNAANGALDKLAPVGAGLSAAQADQDLADIRSGHATPEEPARLRAATRLTQQQKDDLAAGKPVNMSQGQFDYLTEIMRREDGTKIADLEDLGANLPPNQRARFQSEFTNGMQLISNPQIHAASADGTTSGDVGGMSRLPSEVRTLLTENPVDAKNQLVDDNTRVGFFSLRREGDWKSLNTMLTRGDKSVAQGSDLNRGVLKQTAEMAAAAGTDKHQLLDALVSNAGADRHAVHDFATGRNMDVTCDHGGHYNTDDHTKALLNYQWAKGDHGVTAMLDWIPGDIDSSNSDVSQRALDTAAGMNSALDTAPAAEHLPIANALLTHSSVTGLPKLMDAMPALEPHATTDSMPDPRKIAWKALDGPVFGPAKAPSIEDVNQGQAGDCYDLGALAGLAEQDPSYIQNHIHDNHNGTYTVDLYDGDGKPASVTVTDQVPVGNDGKVLYAHGRHTAPTQPGVTDPSTETPQWSAIYEKAMAEQGGGYSAIDQGGHSNTGIEELTGQHVGQPNPGGALNELNTFLPGLDGPGGVSLSDLKTRLDNGEVIVTGTAEWPDTRGVVADHEYTVTAVDPDNGIITVRNPWGNFDSKHPEYLELTRDQWDNDFTEWSGANPR